MVLAELGVSRASGPPWSTKTSAASSLPPTELLDSTSTAKPTFAPFHLSPPCPVAQSFFLLTTYLLLHSSPTLYFLLSILPPFPCHFSPMKYWQGSHLFLLLQHCPMCLLATERISPCPSTLSSDHNFESISPTSLIFPMAQSKHHTLHKAEGEKGGRKTDFQTSIEK